MGIIDIFNSNKNSSTDKILVENSTDLNANINNNQDLLSNKDFYQSYLIL